ncbi:hypothetical protein [Neobacillus cucumis]|uniref:hypothetical protein n=1 Tax=Neobacillus cucumis TaxID=1740721 RepID=UPI0028532960|nr:hypothetical protein [Neobacillus cucumis]MDR4946511.1 hypothetical protein [Neobacillus cucumis]
MAEFSKELIRALANGSKEAYEEIKNLPLALRMAIGVEVDKLKREENIVPMDGGAGFSIYEQKKSNYVDDDAVRESMQRMMDIRKENEERAEKAREEFIKEQTRHAVERARSGLTRNDRLPR